MSKEKEIVENEVREKEISDVKQNKEKNSKSKTNNKTKSNEFLKKISYLLKKYSVVPYVIIGVALFFLSMMLTAQVKSMSNTEELLEGKRQTELSEELINLQRKYDDLKEKYDDSTKVVEEYQNNSATNNTLISSMKEQIETLSALSGTTNLKGEGIILTLDDGSLTQSNTVRSDTLVHDSDLITVVNELKAAGAEAISINGQRIIATSAIRCVGPVIQVNYQKVAAPFEIRAIGNAQYLESAMIIKGGVVDLLKEYGVDVNVTREYQVQIPKYEGTLSFKTAVSDNK